VTSVPRIDAPTLETARLRLRAWQPEELAWYLALRADPEVSRFLGDGHPESASEARISFEWGIAAWARLGLGGWAIEERSTWILVGYCGLPLWREGTPEEAVEIGYGYARDAWGKGYATEAAAAAMRWAFEVRGFDALVALTSPENRASQRVLAKLGFTRDGEAEARYGRGPFFRVTRPAFEASPPFQAARAASN
jgi:RimJ/RimL family protein N-acetyltransferase